MSNTAPHLEAIAYRVKAPLKALVGKPLIDVVIPIGSTIEWQKGEYDGRMAIVYWLRRRVLVMEADLFRCCERLGSDCISLGVSAEQE